MPTIIRTYSAPDGTQLTVYRLPDGYQNTMPTKLFNQKFNIKNKIK